jgi:hypothetical protein
MTLLTPAQQGAEERTEQDQPPRTTRDLSAELQAIERAISKQSAASREYLSGKFKLS